MASPAAYPTVSPTVLAAARELRGTVSGEVLTRSDAGFEAARAIWNGAAGAVPASVVRCATEDDVATTVRVARDHGLPLSVRAGGHDWAGRSIVDDGVVVDLTAMRHITIDFGAGPGAGADAGAGAVARVGGGTRAGDLVAAADPHGLVAVTGTVKAVGLAGLTLGGGYGLLAGRHGLAADNLVGARAVLADGRIVDATNGPGADPDLFWALRGGGGNFGVVTQLRFRLHRQPLLLAGLVLYPLDEAAAVLRGYRDVIAGAPDELTVMAGFFSLPDGPPVLFLLPAWCGEPAAGEAAVAPLRRLGTPVADQVEPRSLLGVLGMFDGSIANGRHNEMSSRWLPALGDADIDALVAAASCVTSPYSGIFLHHFHGAASRVPVGDTPFALRRDHLQVEIAAAWQPGEHGAAGGTAAAHRRWARELAAELDARALPGGYPNLLGGAENDRALRGFGPNLARLREVKRRLDPDGVFGAVPDLRA